MSRKLIVVAAVFTIIGGIAILILALMFHVHAGSTAAPCLNNLKQLNEAKQQWTLEYHKTTNDIPTMEDINPFLSMKPFCPEGGTYNLGRVGESPKCSIGGALHTMPQ
jgi:hypothetical protein